MTRTVTFLLLGWTMLFAPAVACSRDNNVKANPVEMANTEDVIVDTSGSLHSYLALGDSYTIATSVPVTGAYPNQVVRLLETKAVRFSEPEIIATNGWTTTNLLAALAAKDSSKTYDMVTLLIGVNNQYQGGSIENYSDEFTRLLEKSIGLAGHRPQHVVVLSIPDYSVTPFGRGRGQSTVAAQIDAFNNVNRTIALAHGVQYLNITEDTRAAASDPLLLAPDSLHYSAQEYSVWAEALVPMFYAVNAR